VAVLTPQDPLRGLDDLARQVAKRGIRRVDGDVVIDDRLWKARRVNKEVISPIQVNDNLIDITMTPTTTGRRVTFRTRPATKAYEIEMRVRTVGRGGPLAFEVGEAVGRKVVVTGTLPAGIKPLVAVARVPEPATFARTLFIEALRRAGVEVDAAAVGSNRAKALPSPGVVSRLARVARFTSPPLSEFVKLISKSATTRGRTPCRSGSACARALPRSPAGWPRSAPSRGVRGSTSVSSR
jgi:serine-type D-Ala-D-Ala carboxypeptidase/endopeptidase (penicillin-binding protein 4)